MTIRDTRRTFTETQKKEILVQQDYLCAECHNKLDLRVVEYHHIKAWSANGQTVIRNGAALCPNCHALKSHKQRLKSVETKSTRPQPVSPSSLGELGLTQLRSLAQKHHIKVTGTKRWNLWDGDYTDPPTKRQYVAKLKGIVTTADINALRGPRGNARKAR